MEIRINSLTLHNFKGVRGDRTFTFGGGNARIEGENGTGKSTVFDAFTWLLFGKDHQGRDWTNFNIKPLDPVTHRTVEGLDYTAVEADLLVDGLHKRLRRTLSEDWVKPRGEAERILKGHTQAFFIDGVACDTKKAYDITIHSMIDENVFRIVTNPLHLIDDRFTSWQDRRKVLLAAVGYNPDAVAADFADLLAEMRGEGVELFRKRVAAEKKAQKENLAKANANIDAWNAALPQEQDTAAVDAQLRALTAERDARKAALHELIAKTDAAISDVAAANKAQELAISEKRREIVRIKAEADNYTDKALTAQKEANGARKRAISEANTEVERLKQEIASLETRSRRLASRLNDCKVARGDEAARLTALGAQYEAEKAKAFAEDIDRVCPACGRPYSEEDIAKRSEEARRRFIEERKAALKAISDRVPPIRAEIASWDNDIAKTSAEIENVDAELKAKREDFIAACQALGAARDLPEVDMEEAARKARKSPEYAALQEHAARLEAEIEEIAAKSVSTKELLADRQRHSDELAQLNERYEEDARPLRDVYAVDKERQRILAMIREEDTRRRGYANELARLERLEVRTLEYIKASVDACEGTINARFRDARWKMFDRTLDGGIVEMCEVTTLDGVPYRSMNDAARIICGLDVIRVLSEANSVQAPIFIDNAEGVTRRDFGTPAQVIRLVVKEGSALTLVNE